MKQNLKWQSFWDYKKQEENEEINKYIFVDCNRKVCLFILLVILQIFKNGVYHNQIILISSNCYSVKNKIVPI